MASLQPQTTSNGEVISHDETHTLSRQSSVDQSVPVAECETDSEDTLSNPSSNGSVHQSERLTETQSEDTPSSSQDKKTARWVTNPIFMTGPNPRDGSQWGSDSPYLLGHEHVLETNDSTEDHTEASRAGLEEFGFWPRFFTFSLSPHLKDFNNTTTGSSNMSASKTTDKGKGKEAEAFTDTEEADTSMEPATNPGQIAELLEQTKIFEPPESSSEWYEFKESPGKGLGVFATKKIQAGTRIVVEKPFLTLRHAEKIFDAFGRLSESEKQKFLTLGRHHGEGYKRQLARGLEKLGESAQIPTKRKEAEAHAELFAILEMNVWRGKDELYVFEQASRFNHSCLPNAWAAHNFKLVHQTIQAIQDIAAGEEILISYTSTEELDREARTKEFAKLGFKCDCLACDGTSAFGKTSDIRRNLYCVLQDQYRQFDRETLVKGCEEAVRLQLKMIEMLEKEGCVGLRLADCYSCAAANMTRLNTKDERILDLTLKFFSITRLVQGEDSEEYQEKMKGVEYRSGKDRIYRIILKQEKAASRKARAALGAET